MNRKNRLAAFCSLKGHAWYGKVFEALSCAELELCMDFIDRHENLNRHKFEQEVNRMFLDKYKPKHWTMIMECLSTANSIAGGTYE